MFDWFKKGRGSKADKAAEPVSGTDQASDRPSKDQLIQQAIANAQIAREAIGEETLSKLSAIIEKKNRQMQLEKLRADIIRKMEMDSGKMADHLKYMLQDKKTDH